MSMFKSALLRLTVGYLAFIMLLSLGFSTLLYRISASELERDFQQRVAMLQHSPLRNAPGVQELIALRTEQIEESKDRLRGDFVVMNLVILFVGGGLAYLLAKRNLAPIEEAHEAQTRFTADASHELRTPLAAMRSEIEVALRDRKLTLSGAKKLLESNIEELDKLEALANGLLKLARHDRPPEALEPVHLPEVVAEATERLAVMAREKSIILEISSEDFLVMGDRWSLVELVTILLDNALKYSPPATTITVIVKKVGAVGQLVVSDHGVGIAPTDLPHIFDRFYRADAARSKQQVVGYGLGLAIAKQIVEAHRGTITALNLPEKGTTITVRLPLAR